MDPEQTLSDAGAGRQMKLSEATKMIENYVKGCNDDNSEIKSLTISASHLKNILAQHDCEYVRLFFALNGDIDPGKIGVATGHTLVLVGVNSNDENIINGEDDSQVYEDLKICPPNCGEGGSVL